MFKVGIGNRKIFIYHAHIKSGKTDLRYVLVPNSNKIVTLPTRRVTARLQMGLPSRISSYYNSRYSRMLCDRIKKLFSI